MCVPDMSSLSPPQNQGFTGPRQKCLLCPLSRERSEEGEALFSCTQLSRQQSAGGAGETLARPLERRRNSFHLTPSPRPRSVASRAVEKRVRAQTADGRTPRAELLEKKIQGQSPGMVSSEVEKAERGEREIDLAAEEGGTPAVCFHNSARTLEFGLFFFSPFF